MTISKLLTSSVVYYALLAAAVFFGFVSFVPLDTFIILLNGILTGALFGITVAYGPVFWKAILGDTALYPDARKMAVGFLITWFAYGVVVYTSVYVRAADLPFASLYGTAVSRYAAILGALIQINAPNYEHGFLSSRDQKATFIGIATGIVVAGIIVYLQAAQVLKLTGD